MTNAPPEQRIFLDVRTSEKADINFIILNSLKLPAPCALDLTLFPVFAVIT